MAVAEIALHPMRFTAEAMPGLGDFFHLEVINHVQRSAEATIETEARQPRDNQDWPKVDVFASAPRAAQTGLG